MGLPGGDSRCPACGQPLYGWLQLDTPAGPTLLERCENCRLGLAAGLGPEDAANELVAHAASPGGGALELRVANRDSWQARLGGVNWAALELGRGLYPTPKALELLAGKSGLTLARVRSPRWAGQLWMWQTLVNAFTFNHNFAIGVRGGLVPSSGGRAARLKYAIDALVTVLATPLLLLVSIPLELVAAIAGKGGVLVAVAAQPSAEYENVDQ